MNFRSIASFVLLAALSSCTASTTTTGGTATTGGASSSGGDSNSSITFRNHSAYAIFHIYMSSVNTTAWGPDHLGTSVLHVNSSFTLRGVPCDHYDLKIVDEDGDECILHNIDICAEDSGWNIDTNDLLTCQAFTAANGQR